MVKKTVLCLALLISQFSFVQSQEVVSSSGETFQSSTLQLDWTLGEVAIETLESPSQILTQGFHQPVYTITSLEELKHNLGTIEVFPNPTSDRLEMKLDFKEHRSVKISLLDVNGKLIWKKEIAGQTFSKISDISHLSSGSYFLHFFFEEEDYSQTFKIQKHN